MKTNAYSIYGYPFTLTDLIVNVGVILIVVLWYYIKWNNRHIDKLASRLNGPKAYPIIGAAHHLFGSPQYILKKIIKFKNDYGPEPFKLWLGPTLSVVLSKPEDVQDTFLFDNTHWRKFYTEYWQKYFRDVNLYSQKSKLILKSIFYYNITHFSFQASELIFIVVNNSMAFERGLLRNFYSNILGKGLSTASLDVWKVHRRLITPAFNINVLKQLLPVFNNKLQILIKNLQSEVGKKQSFDLWNYIASTTVDTICHTSMGYDFGTNSNNDYESFIENLEKASMLNTMRLYRPWYYPDIVFSIYLRLTGQQTIFDKIKELPNRVIKERKEILKKNKLASESNVHNCDEKKKGSKILLDILMELNDIGENFSDEEVKDEVLTMIAGSEPGAVASCFCLLLLAIHQDIQDKVYNELYQVFGYDDQTYCTYEDINTLVYLEQVLNETLRIFPIIPIFFRTLQDDIKIFSGNLTLPKGTECAICPISTHYMPELYPNPSIFNPENFNSENVSKRHKYSFIAFSGGPRGCIGYKYAMLSMKVLVSTFLRNFSVHTDIKFSDIDLKFDVIMKSVNGYPVTIVPRTNIPM